MTNFQGTQVRQPAWFSPERLVLLMPIAGGVLATALLLLVGLPAQVLQIQQRRTAITELERQQQELPLLIQQFNASQLQLQQKQLQQQRLLSLVAGTQVLRTWLAGLNDIAAAQGVRVTLIEPGAVERYVPPPPSPPAAASTATAPAPAAAPAKPLPRVDPLLAPKLEKRSAVITVRGPYLGLLGFLRQLEALDVIALASELELKPVQEGGGGNSVGAANAPQPAGGLLELKLKLTAYGRSARVR